MTVRALLDANVLYSATLRSLLIDLSLPRVDQAHWTDELQGEWIRNLLAHRPDLDRAKLQRTRELMDRAIDTARITGYEHLQGQVHLPDPGDRHVVAAAVHGRVDLIVTQNLRDFPEGVLGSFGLRAIHPDELLQGFLAAQPEQVLQALRVHRARFRSPPISAVDMLEALKRQGVPLTVTALRPYTDQF